MTVNIQAPVGGWNARDSLDDMPPEDAVLLENWVPDSGYCRLRGGSELYTSGLGGDVLTLAEYHAAGVRKFLAAADGNLWDITDGSAPVSLASGYSLDRWQFTHHSGRLLLVNGVDSPQAFDGTAIAAMDFTGTTWGSSAPENLHGVTSFKGRALYREESRQGFWYAAAGSYQGALNWFPLDSVVQKGGDLSMILTWTRDSGDGVDDLAVFYFSSGEVLVYQGSDPGDANDWALVGRFQLGEPLGARGRAKLAGDEVIITKDGYINLGAALSNGRVSDRDKVSQKINAAVKADLSRFGNNPGWQALLYPAGSLFLVNVPISSSQSEQHVLNTNTGSWTKFTGWYARCFTLFADALYFGGNGEVYKADTGYSDSGALIKGRAITAFNYCGTRSRKKLLTAAQVVSNYMQPQYIGLSAAGDFRPPLSPSNFLPPEQGGTSWDSSGWDASGWSQTEGRIIASWRSLMAEGYAIALNVVIQSRLQAVKWYATKLKVKFTGEI